jgi:DNA-directed RNA polymerase subunit RPC12/RpoP
MTATIAVYAGLKCGHPVESGTLRSTTTGLKAKDTAHCTRCGGRVVCVPAKATVDPLTHDIVSTKLDPPHRKVTDLTLSESEDADLKAGIALVLEAEPDMPPQLARMVAQEELGRIRRTRRRRTRTVEMTHGPDEVPQVSI